MHIVRGGQISKCKEKRCEGSLKQGNRQHIYIWFCNVYASTTDEFIELKELLKQAESLAHIIGLTEAKLKISTAKWSRAGHKQHCFSMAGDEECYCIFGKIWSVKRSKNPTVLR